MLIAILMSFLVSVIETSQPSTFSLQPFSVEASEPTLTSQKIEGVAKNKQGKVLYTEQHENFFKNNILQKRKSQFFSPEGQLIAIISSDFSKSICLPDYSLINYQVDSEEVIRVTEETILAKYRPPGEKKFTEKTFPREENVCSGFGISEYLAAHLPAIMAGEDLHMKFLPVPKFQIYPMHSKITSVKGYEASQYVSVIFELDMGLIGMLIPAAEFVFDKESKSIAMYHGPSNILNKFGTRATVWVTYRNL